MASHLKCSGSGGSVVDLGEEKAFSVECLYLALVTCPS